MSISVADPTDGSITFGTRAEEFSRYIETLSTLGKTLNFPPTDARSVVLSNLIGAASGARIALRLLHAIDPDIVKNPPEALKTILQLKSAADVMWAKKDLERTCKIGFLLESQFQIENFLRNILRTTRTVGDAEGFGQIARDVLRYVGLEDSNKKLAVLKIPAKIRNSLHQNGIHAFNEKSEDLGIFSGHFKKDDRVSCGTYGFLLIAIWSSCEIVEELLKHDRIRSMKIVEDRYTTLKDRV